MIDKKSPIDMILPEDQQAHQTTIAGRLSEEQKETSSQFRIITNQEKSDTLTPGGVHTMFQGRTATIGTVLDITEQKQAEEALRESENKFRDLAEKAVVGIYIAQGRLFRYVNEACAKIHGMQLMSLLTRKALLT